MKFDILKTVVVISIASFFLAASIPALAGEVLLTILNAPDPDTGEIFVVSGDDVEVEFNVLDDTDLRIVDRIELVLVSDGSILAQKTRGNNLTGTISLKVTDQNAINELKVRYVQQDGTFVADAPDTSTGNTLWGVPNWAILEVLNRVVAVEEADYQGQIDAETDARESADMNLWLALDAETNARRDGDTSLQGQLDNEIIARESGDASLQSQIDDEVLAREGGDQAVSSAAQAANDNLQALLEGQIATLVEEYESRIAALEGQLEAAVNRIDELETSVAALDPNGELGKLANYVIVEEDPIHSLVGPHVIFRGVNVLIQNGLGETATINGLGNLIVGYNEWLGGDPPPGDRYASHNLITGSDHLYAGYGGLIAGRSQYNFADYGTIIGGVMNQVWGTYTTVTGGSSNIAHGRRSSISGGFDNYTRGYASSISGGVGNEAWGMDSSICGGSHNSTIGTGSTVSGGRENKAGGKYASVSGGHENLASGQYASVSGGYANTASGQWSSVSGGQLNLANGDYASISGGLENIASGPNTSVSGGYQNLAFGDDSSVSGGWYNITSGLRSSVSGGSHNEAGDEYSTVGGGEGIIIPAGYPYDYVLVPGIWPPALWP